MKVYILHNIIENARARDSEKVYAFQTKELLYKFVLDEILSYECSVDEADSARLFFDKGDYEALLEMYDEICELESQVFETTLIK